MNSDNSKQALARNIKRYMDKKGVTNQQICDDLGFKYTTFMDIIKGVSYPRIWRIEAMADYFGVLKSDLIEDRSEEKAKEIDEMRQNNDALSSVVVRMRMDDKFFSAVLAIDKLDPDKLDNLLALLK